MLGDPEGPTKHVKHVTILDRLAFSGRRAALATYGNPEPLSKLAKGQFGSQTPSAWILRILPFPNVTGFTLSVWANGWLCLVTKLVVRPATHADSRHAHPQQKL